MKRFVLFLVVLYQRFVSPLKGPTCRFRPTCSEYAAEAIEKYGLSRGGLLAVRRLLRCHPFSRGGYDPLIGKGDDR
jgi:putative membrane protein insertion efficiency factor